MLSFKLKDIMMPGLELGPESMTHRILKLLSTVPAKPNSRLQKYSLNAKGKTILRQGAKVLGGKKWE